MTKVYLLVESFDDGDVWDEYGTINVNLVGVFQSKKKAKKVKTKYPDSHIVKVSLDKVVNKTLDSVDYCNHLYYDPYGYLTHIV